MEVKQLTNRVVSKGYGKNVLKFEKSDDNIVRSIATYYPSGVMGKRKYKVLDWCFQWITVLLVQCTSNFSRKLKFTQVYILFQKCFLTWITTGGADYQNKDFPGVKKLPISDDGLCIGFWFKISHQWYLHYFQAVGLVVIPVFFS